MKAVRKKVNQLMSYLYVLGGAFIISYGWNYYHINRHQVFRFWLITASLALGAIVGFYIGQQIYIYLAKNFARLAFWQIKFPKFFNELFFILSLLFVVFFLTDALSSLLYATVIVFVLYWRLDYYLSHHPDSANWRRVNTSIFALAMFLFFFQAAAQYATYRYYILDDYFKFTNVVFFRALAMTLFWLFGFAVANFFYWQIKNWTRYVLISFWAGLFLFYLLLWSFNIGVLYFFGLFITPTALGHLGGSGGLFSNNVVLILAIALIMAVVIFGLVMRKIIVSHQVVTKRYWYYYNVVIGLVAISVFASVSSLTNTPEFSIGKNFYNYFFGAKVEILLDKHVQKKLEKFGFFYDANKFYVNQNDEAFEASSNLLPAKLQQTNPNLIFVFLEGFSARLSGVYNQDVKDVTPNLIEMATNRNTTIFHNYYNSSTPTITGMLSALCSFLPPTGHNEITIERRIQNHHLLCLPKALKQSGYKDIKYITAVSKSFSNKESIFKSMGVDSIWGKEELAEIISGEPLAWGYSDHQLFPAMWQLIEERNSTEDQPFVIMMTTIDTHPPFDLAQDEIPYGNGQQQVLNAFHTTDNAFGEFWNEFVASEFYNNTIVVAIADHSIFPGELTKDITKWGDDLDKESATTYYDKNTFLLYVPETILPKEVAYYSSGIDLTPTILHLLNLNMPNSFEGHSIFGQRQRFPNLLGMHEFGLYINQAVDNGERVVDYNVPSHTSCPSDYDHGKTEEFTLCDYLHFYKWKRQMFEQGRFWYTNV